MIQHPWTVTALSLLLQCCLNVSNGMADDDPRPVRCRILTTDGDWQSGRLREYLHGSLRYRTADQDVSPDWMRIEFPDSVRPTISSRQTWLELTNGDRIAAQIVETAEDTVRARRVFRQQSIDFEIPLEYVAGITWGSSPSPPVPVGDSFPDPSAAAAPDLSILTNGDRLPGEFVSLNRRELSIRTSDSVVLNLPLDRVRRIRFNPFLLTTDGLRKPSSLVQFADGSWMGCIGCRWNRDGSWTFQPTFDRELQLTETMPQAIRRIAPRFQSLTALAPESYLSRPFVGSPVPLVVNRSSNRSFLLVGGRSWPAGFGVRSRSELTFDLNGEYERFQTEVGLDDEACKRADATFQIIVDGRILATGKLQRTKESRKPISVNLPVQNARSLQLTVNYGKDGDLCDLVNWLDPVLIRRTAPPVQD